jgi:carbon storage regulator
MTTNQTARSRGMSLVWSAVFRTARLLIFGLIGWLLFVSAADSAWRAVSLAAVLALAALVGITWYLSRARAERRWRTALDAYAEKELAKRTLTRGEPFMLVLKRKIGERIVVPHFGFAVRVIAIEGKTVRLGISAPEDIAVYREEVWQQLRQQTHGPAPKG